MQLRGTIRGERQLFSEFSNFAETVYMAIRMAVACCLCECEQRTLGSAKSGVRRRTVAKQNTPASGPVVFRARSTTNRRKIRWRFVRLERGRSSQTDAWGGLPLLNPKIHIYGDVYEKQYLLEVVVFGYERYVSEHEGVIFGFSMDINVRWRSRVKVTAWPCRLMSAGIPAGLGAHFQEDL